MKKIALTAVLFITGYLLAAQHIVSFDQLSFAEPSSWTFADQGTYHVYSVADNSSNTFCIISIYSSDISSGNSREDFNKAWEGIIAGHFTVSKSPAPTQNTSAGGINYLQDEANVSNNQGNYFARLLVFKLTGKTQSVLFLSGNKNSLVQYQPDLNNFLASLKLNNLTTAIPGTANTSTVTNTSSASNSGLTHFSHFLFNVPAGWKTSQQQSSFIMSPPDLESDELLIYVLLPPVTDTSFNNTAVSTLKYVAQSFNGEAVQEQISGPGPLYIKENEGKYKKGWDYSLGHGSIRVGTPTPNSPGIINYQFYHAGVFLSKINGRIERAVYLSKDVRRNFADNSTYRKPTYESIIKNFFFDLEFDDWTDAKIVPGKVTHSGISNVWGGLAYFEGSLGSTFSEGSVKATYLVLYDNGQVYYNKELPKEGLNNINTFTQAALYPRWWGTYTYQNGSGVIKLSYVSIPFTLKDGKIYLDIYQKKIPYDPMPVPDGAKLNGSWCEKGQYGGKKACISFTDNGQFSDNGIVLRIEHPVNNVFHSIPENGQGTYEIKNNSVIFHYNSGFLYQAAFSGLGMTKNNPSPNEIHLGFNDDVFQKQ